MKRLRSSDDLNSFGENSGSKDWGKKDDSSSLSRSSSHRNYYYKAESGRKVLSSSSSRYDRLDDDRENSRFFRKRTDYDSESYDRRVSYDRYRDNSYRGIVSSSPRGGYSGDRIQRSESFSGPRRDFPKGFRSERDRPRRDSSSSSWRRFEAGKDVDEGIKPVCDSIRSNKAASEEKGKLRIPQGVEEAKSPPWSKDSGSERSRSVEVSKSVEGKKSEDFQAESGNSSEMEEGELEPEPTKEINPEPANESEPVSESKTSIEPSHDHRELENAHNVEDTNGELNKDNVIEEKLEAEPLKTSEDLQKEGEESPHSQNNSTPGTSGNEDLTVTAAVDGDSKMEELPVENQSTIDEGRKDVSANQSMPSEDEVKGDEGVGFEVNVGEKVFPESCNTVSMALSLQTDCITPGGKDKGKEVALSLSNVMDSVNTEVKVEGDSVVTCRDDYLEGPSFRGLDLFARDPVKMPEKSDPSGFGRSKDEKLKFEPLDLSLSLPNVLLPINTQNVVRAPDSPSHGRSAQSLPRTFCTNSEGLSMSMSFSGSMAFTHNPSCSLTHNSFDNYEQSVHSKPLFGGVDWNSQQSNENMQKELPMHERAVSNNGSRFYQSQASASHSIPNDLSASGHIRAAEGNSKLPFGVDRQMSLHRQLSGVHSRHQHDAGSPSQSVGSFEKRSEYSKDKTRLMREKDSGSLQNGKDKFLMGGTEAVEPVINMIVSQPVHVIAKNFNEMTEQSTASLKESVRDIISDAGKKWHLSAFQKALNNRSDITLEVLLKAHRAQLEILVALKTGLQEFLQRNSDISASDLAEVFLNLRCRNLTCRSLLPVDECDCKLCAQKDGFCSSCMCLLCSKFDMASNTCSWVGCDVCLHWCHVDCALRGSYIRNGCSASGPQGTTEMQFHCVACNHPSEMFGFVKEVFQSFARVWTAQTLSKELHCVLKIFSASDDIRGKQLHNIAGLMSLKLANNCDLVEVQNEMLSFLTDSDSFRSATTPIVSRNDPPNTAFTQEATWRLPPPEKAPQLERRPSFTTGTDSQRTSRKEPVFDELDSIVRIKQAEAKMFQARADEARREAEGLKRIAVAKSERTEEEYKSRIAKLHLLEAEEIRKQKFEELQSLERAHREYFNMKLRMEADIKELWAKMEAAKRNITM